jgi:hypothetical protein
MNAGIEWDTLLIGANLTPAVLWRGAEVLGSQESVPIIDRLSFQESTASINAQHSQNASQQWGKLHGDACT